jgi:hypothetical protein
MTRRVGTHSPTAHPLGSSCHRSWQRYHRKWTHLPFSTRTGNHAKHSRTRVSSAMRKPSAAESVLSTEIVR